MNDGKEDLTWMIGSIGSAGLVMAVRAVLILTAPFDLDAVLRGLKM